LKKQLSDEHLIARTVRRGIGERKERGAGPTFPSHEFGYSFGRPIFRGFRKVGTTKPAICRAQQLLDLA
jgi:hypothetical protein